jgi:hypothetical protein
MTTEPNNASPHTGHGSGVGEELKGDAGRLKETLQDRAMEEAENRKGQAASALGSASSALNNAADELQNNADAPDWLAAAVKQAASKIDAMAGQIQGRDISEIGDSVADFARQNPGAFLAASAAAGFAAARVLRAGADRSHDAQTGGTGSTYGGSGFNQGGNGWREGGQNAGGGLTAGGLAGTVERDIGGVAP